MEVKRRLVVVRGITQAGRATVDVAWPWREIESRAVDRQLRLFGTRSEDGPEGSDLSPAPDEAARTSSGPSSDRVPENRSGFPSRKTVRKSGRISAERIRPEVLEKVGSAQLSMKQAFMEVAGIEPARPAVLPGSNRHGNCDFDIKKSRNLDIEICQEDQDQVSRDVMTKGVANERAWEEEIHRALGDPRLKPIVARKVALALAHGRIKWSTVSQVCRSARRIQHTKGQPAWFYFAGTMPKVFLEEGAGLPWKWRALAEALERA